MGRPTSVLLGSEFLGPPPLNRLTSVGQQSLIVRDVVKRQENGAKHFLGREQVPEIAATPAAGSTGAVLVERAIVQPGIRGQLRTSTPATMPWPAGWHGRLKHNRSPVHRMVERPEARATKDPQLDRVLRSLVDSQASVKSRPQRAPNEIHSERPSLMPRKAPTPSARKTCLNRDLPWLGRSLTLLLLVLSIGDDPRSSLAQSCAPLNPTTDDRLRGFFFNPWVNDQVQGEAWLKYYHQHREAVDRELKELVEKTGINFIDIQVLIPRTLADPKTPPVNRAAAIDAWADMRFMENLVRFLDMCQSNGVQVEVDLASNMWIPFSVDTKNHIANSRWWPEPDSTPWTESIVWYTQIIEYVERHVHEPDAIALWCMFGNYQFGGAEPVLWTSTTNPLVNRYTELFVKNVWPKFCEAGKRPKGTPIVLPIFSDNAHWMARDSSDRLGAAENLKEWLVDDLQLPPDYWIVTTYPYSDPAPDGIEYLGRLIEIVGNENASRIISTDFKATGHDLSQTIISPAFPNRERMLRWNLSKVRQYDFAGWWIWAYRDTNSHQTGIRDVGGNWREDLVGEIKAAENR